MGKDFVEINVSVDPRAVATVFSICFVTSSTSTRSGAVDVDGACFGFFGFFAVGIR